MRSSQIFTNTPKQQQQQQPHKAQRKIIKSGIKGHASSSLLCEMQQKRFTIAHAYCIVMNR
ncbi:unnamed protein product [Ceratitis capitata]|uniref:(Mediterranean fruit fly) hypothetical protein n=1 Tax=Ceratitis capitata TaxID=7213 RepID=A0A811VGB0_CERCA|nr:unnamed protein product [Ceratitis capitata]